MTTAHRPTFDPARGKEAGRGEAYHQRLLPAHKTLKFRQQAADGKDLRAELLKNESRHYARKDGREIADEDDEAEGGRLRIEGGVTEGDEGRGRKRKLSADAGDGGAGEEEEEEDYETKRRRVLAETAQIDADSSHNSSSSSDSSSDEDEEDETATLLAELAKIKAERAEKAAAEAAAQAKIDQEQREKDIALGNPLLNGDRGRHSGEYGVKRRWDDDVVFKNQARGTEERGKERRFVNDLLRSDFHRRFMDKYVR